MKYSTLINASFATLAAAAPAADLDTRQACEYGFVFARGSSEPSPLGMLIGPSLQTALKGHFPSLKTFPVLYAASLATNVSPARTDQASITKGVEAFKQAAGCRVIFASGYSQGAAVMHNVVGVGNNIDQSIKSKIAGVALFGDTRNKQDGGHIPNFPSEKSKVWCNASDGVCGGQLNVNAGHLAYSNAQIKEAGDWLAQRAKSAGGAGAASSSSPAKGGAGAASSSSPAKGGAGASSPAKGGAGAASSSSPAKGGAGGSGGLPKGGAGGSSPAKGSTPTSTSSSSQETATDAA